MTRVPDLTRVVRRAEALAKKEKVAEQSWATDEATGRDRPNSEADEPLAASPDSARAGEALGGSAFKSPSPEQSEAPASVQPYKSMPIGGGNAVMNNDILRSSAFSRPDVNTSLKVIAYRANCSVEQLGLAPSADHMDVLLYAVSLVEHAPSPGQNVEVSFNSHQFLNALGWAVNSDGYWRVSAVLQELKQIELLFYDGPPAARESIRLKDIVVSFDATVGEKEAQRWTVSLPAALFRIFGLGRNTVIDLNARAMLRSEFGRWLHGFFSSQAPGPERRYDAESLCYAGRLRSGRLGDDLKQLRQTLRILAAGRLVYRGRERTFAPVLETGARIERDARTGRYMLHAARAASRAG